MDQQHLEQKIKVVNQGIGGGAQPSPHPTLSSAQDAALHRAASTLLPCWKSTSQEGLRDCSQQVCMWLYGCGGEREFICTTAATFLRQKATPVPAHFISTNTAIIPTGHFGLQPTSELPCLCFDEIRTRP